MIESDGVSSAPREGERPTLRSRWATFLRRWIPLFVVLGAVEALFAYDASAGFLREWPTFGTNFDSQAEGFRSGHLWVALAPSPELVAKADPFNPTNSDLWAWDFSLYKGHYYLYWGPLPALAVLAVKTILRLKNPVGDQYPFFAFVSLTVAAGILLIERMARRLFPRVSTAVVVGAAVVFAVGHPFPSMCALAGVYQVAIMGAQAFLLLGLVLAFDGLWVSHEGRRRALTRFIIAGALWGMAIACRVSAGPTAALLLVLTALASPRVRIDGTGRARVVLALATPIAVIVLVLLVFNKLRFDSWMEFGTSLQLTTMRYHASTSYLFPNLYSYLLRPLTRSCHFPFVEMPWDIGPRGFPAGYVFPAGYSDQEPVAGMWRIAPWSLLAPVAVLVGLRSLRAWRARSPTSPPHATERLRLWCLGSFAVLAVVTGLPAVVNFIATNRYLGDVAAGTSLCGAWLAFWLTTRLEDRAWARRGVWLALASLGAVTIVYGFLLGFLGYGNHFKQFNPTYYEHLERLFSTCR